MAEAAAECDDGDGDSYDLYDDVAGPQLAEGLSHGFDLEQLPIIVSVSAGPQTPARPPAPQPPARPPKVQLAQPSDGQHAPQQPAGAPGAQNRNHFNQQCLPLSPDSVSTTSPSSSLGLVLRLLMCQMFEVCFVFVFKLAVRKRLM